MVYALHVDEHVGNAIICFLCETPHYLTYRAQFIEPKEKESDFLYDLIPFKNNKFKAFSLIHNTTFSNKATCEFI